MRYSKYLAASLNNSGFWESQKGNPDEARKYFEQALKIQEDIDDKKGMTATLSNLGEMYQNKGFTDKAIECFL
jgi:tetratricopeptide (TPR) repeat protein